MRNRTKNLLRDPDVLGPIFFIIVLVFSVGIISFSITHENSINFCETHYEEDSINYYECVYEYKNGMLRHEILDKIPGEKNE